MLRALIGADKEYDLYEVHTICVKKAQLLQDAVSKFKTSDVDGKLITALFDIALSRMQHLHTGVTGDGFLNVEEVRGVSAFALNLETPMIQLSLIPTVSVAFWAQAH